MRFENLYNRRYVSIFTSSTVGTKFLSLSIGERIVSLKAEQTDRIGANSFFNLFVLDVDVIEISDCDGVELEVYFTDDLFLSKMDKKNLRVSDRVVSESGIVYYSRGSKSPKKLIFTFPGFSEDGTGVSLLGGTVKEAVAVKSNVRVIVFQDNFNVYGSYMMFGYDGSYIFDRVLDVVDGIVSSYGVDCSDVIIAGGSKGAVIAYNIALRRSGFKYICMAPQIKVKRFFVDTRHQATFVMDNFESRSEFTTVLDLTDELEVLHQSDTCVDLLIGLNDVKTLTTYTYYNDSSFKVYYGMQGHEICANQNYYNFFLLRSSYRLRRVSFVDPSVSGFYLALCSSAGGSFYFISDAVDGCFNYREYLELSELVGDSIEIVELLLVVPKRLAFYDITDKLERFVLDVDVEIEFELLREDEGYVFKVASSVSELYVRFVCDGVRYQRRLRLLFDGVFCLLFDGDISDVSLFTRC